MENKNPTEEEQKKYYLENYGYAGWISQKVNAGCHFRTCAWCVFEAGVIESRNQTLDDVKKIIDRLEYMFIEKDLIKRQLQELRCNK